jgi:alpha-D-ribose 1-methylphosphonate 5-phosphate C-P lyase
MAERFRDLLEDGSTGHRYNFAYLDEGAKREIRRRTLKAVAIPGHQIPFASREIPITRGWGTGGLQLTMSLIGPRDVLKVIDQGCDGSVNAVNLRRLASLTTGCRTTTRTQEATLIQTRHRIPEIPLREEQILIFQVPIPEPLRHVEPSEEITRRMHAEADYSRIWTHLYEQVVRWGRIVIGARYPVKVFGRYIMDPSPVPRWDIPKLNRSAALMLFAAGREKRIYALPPHTPVEPLVFSDMPFVTEDHGNKSCERCGTSGAFLDEIPGPGTLGSCWVCSDTDHCEQMVERREKTGDRRQKSKAGYQGESNGAPVSTESFS